MKSSSPSPTIFNPELSHTLQVLKFMQAKTEPIFAKALGIKEPDVSAGHAPTTEEPKKNPFHVHPDFPFSVQRDFSDDAVEVAIEVTHYRPPGSNRGLDHRDPNYDPGEVLFGDAYMLDKDGKPTPITLTQLELEAAEGSFWK